MLPMNEYQRRAMTTQAHASTQPLILQPEMAQLLNAVLGLCGEAGECAELLKKVWFHGHDFDSNKLLKEVGDVQWYIAQACDSMKVLLEDVAAANLEKLRERYPQGFESARSIARDE